MIFALLTYLVSRPLGWWRSVYAKPIVVCFAVLLILLTGPFSKTVQAIADDRFDVPEAVAVLFWNYYTLSIVVSGALVFAIWILLNVGPDEDRKT